MVGLEGFVVALLFFYLSCVLDVIVYDVVHEDGSSNWSGAGDDVACTIFIFLGDKRLF